MNIEFCEVDRALKSYKMTAILLGCAINYCCRNKYKHLKHQYWYFKILRSEFTSYSACTKHLADEIGIIL